jgi:hypothetical protein
MQDPSASILGRRHHGARLSPCDGLRPLPYLKPQGVGKSESNGGSASTSISHGFHPRGGAAAIDSGHGIWSIYCYDVLMARVDGRDGRLYAEQKVSMMPPAAHLPVL